MGTTARSTVEAPRSPPHDENIPVWPWNPCFLIHLSVDSNFGQLYSSHTVVWRMPQGPGGVPSQVSEPLDRARTKGQGGTRTGGSLSMGTRHHEEKPSEERQGGGRGKDGCQGRPLAGDLQEGRGAGGPATPNTIFRGSSGYSHAPSNSAGEASVASPAQSCSRSCGPPFTCCLSKRQGPAPRILGGRLPLGLCVRALRWGLWSRAVWSLPCRSPQRGTQSDGSSHGMMSKGGVSWESG